MTASDHELVCLFEHPQERIDLGRAALLLAGPEYPELDLAAQVDPAVSDSQEVQQILAELRKVSAMLN